MGDIMNPTKQINYAFRQILKEELKRQLVADEDATYIASRIHVNFFGLKPDEPARGHRETLRNIARPHAQETRRYLEQFRNHSEGLDRCCSMNIIV